MNDLMFGLCSELQFVACHFALGQSFSELELKKKKCSPKYSFPLRMVIILAANTSG